VQKSDWREPRLKRLLRSLAELRRLGRVPRTRRGGLQGMPSWSRICRMIEALWTAASAAAAARIFTATPRRSVARPAVCTPRLKTYTKVLLVERTDQGILERHWAAIL